MAQPRIRSRWPVKEDGWNHGEHQPPALSHPRRPKLTHRAAEPDNNNTALFKARAAFLTAKAVFHSPEPTFLADPR